MLECELPCVVALISRAVDNNGFGLVVLTDFLYGFLAFGSNLPAALKYCICMEDDGDTDPACALSIEFASLSDLQGVSSQYPEYCNELYILDILSQDMTAARENHGYDAVFDYSIKYMESLIEPSLSKSMAKDGYTYFDCSLVTCPNPSDGVPYGTSFQCLDTT